MNRDLIKIESDGYVLEEIIPNKELIFYKKDNFSDNDLIFTYQDNYVKVNIKSLQKIKKYSK